MALIFTNPLLDEITPELKRKIERAYLEFPELSKRRVVVGITKKHWLDGYAVGEVQCDIWTLARSELFLDEMPSYLDVHPCTEESWKYHARAVRELCIRAIEVRTLNRRYIVWLKNMLRHHFTGPVQLDLFNLDSISVPHGPLGVTPAR